MASKKKKKDKSQPRRPKVNLMAGIPRPKPIDLYTSVEIPDQVREYPFYGAWLMEGWEDRGITPVVVARRQADDDNIIFGMYMVDLFCLGVKDALWKGDLNSKQFNRQLPQLCGDMPEPCEVSLAHEVIYGSIDFARKYGFEPHRDFRKAGLILDPPETLSWKHKLEFGKDGKPLFIPGPYDNARQILNQLKRTAGEGNYNALMMLNGPDDL
ncbi:MAG: hypothetical protein EHM41_25780 [Chloroflexi bacterium]|nr:MAG: hypothetical protein EHM41_25780 [Chloroflexota bacterium]